MLKRTTVANKWPFEGSEIRPPNSFICVQENWVNWVKQSQPATSVSELRPGLAPRRLSLV